MIITFEIIIIEVFDEQKKNKIKNTKIVKDIGTIFIPVQNGIKKETAISGKIYLVIKLFNLSISIKFLLNFKIIKLF